VQWLAGFILSSVTNGRVQERDFYRAKREYGDDRPRLHRGISVLENCNWLFPIQPRRMSDKPTSWHVNPDLHRLFSERATQERERREAIKREIATNRDKLKRVWEP
jgi:hypothetical protein